MKVGKATDVTIRDQIEDVHALTVKVAGIGLGAVDYVADTITLDARAAKLFDLPADTPLPRDTLHDQIHPDDIGRINYQVANLLDPARENHIEVDHRVVHKDGSIVWVNARKEVRFYRDASGQMKPKSGLVAIIDVSNLKRGEAHVKHLMEEIAHRSKNLMSVVQSVAKQTHRSSGPDGFLDAFSNRLSGLASNQDLLLQNDWQHADLRDLIQMQLRGFSGIEDGRLHLDGPVTKLRPSTVQAIGMALHELGTNAAKYGAWSGSEGVVEVTWSRTGAGDLSLTWAERDGPTVTVPSRQGFGRTVLKELVESSIDGEVDVDFAPEGFIWRARVPGEALA